MAVQLALDGLEDLAPRQPIRIKFTDKVTATARCHSCGDYNSFVWLPWKGHTICGRCWGLEEPAIGDTAAYRELTGLAQRRWEAVSRPNRRNED